MVLQRRFERRIADSEFPVIPVTRPENDLGWEASNLQKRPGSKSGGSTSSPILTAPTPPEDTAPMRVELELDTT